MTYHKLIEYITDFTVCGAMLALGAWFFYLAFWAFCMTYELVVGL